MSKDQAEQQTGQTGLEGGIPISPLLDDETRKSFAEKKEEVLDEFVEKYKPKISPGSRDIDEIALGKFNNTVGKLKLEIDECFNQRMQDFASAAAQSVADREALKDELIDKAAEDARKRIDGYKAILDKYVKGPEVVTSEVRDIDHAVSGMDKVLNGDPKLQEVMEKLGKKEKLDKADYERVVYFLNPQDVNKPTQSPEETFDASAAGYLIGMMNVGQRVELVEVFIDSNKGNDASQLIDAFLRAGLIEKEDGEKLFLLAIDKGKLQQKTFEDDFQKKLSEGFYAEEVGKNRDAIQGEVNQYYNGIYATNIMNRVVGRPLIGGLMAAWGLIWFGLNAAVNKGKFWKSPYSFAALAAAGVGTEVATGGLKRGAPWIGGGVFGQMFHGDDTTEKRIGRLEDNARNQLMEVYKGGPDELVSYLNNGGYETIRDLRLQMEREKKEPYVTIDGLIKIEAEKNPVQRDRLEKMKTLAIVNEDSINKKMNKVAEASHILKIKDNETFTAEIAAIQDEQKADRELASAPPKKPPEGGNAQA